MLSAIDEYFLNQQEPEKSILLCLRHFILNFRPGIQEVWQYGMPFYTYNGKRCCYLWLHKKFKQPYMGIVDGIKIDHPDLMQEKRARMKILLLDPARDIPLDTIKNILNEVLALYGAI